MGIDPVEDTIGNDCIACWAADQTPTLLKCFFSGIMTGEDWHGGLPLPPNGYHDILQDGANPCKWFQAPGSPINIGYHPATPPGPQLALLAQTLGAHNIFLGFQFAQCGAWFENSLNVWAGAEYYGGFAFITTPQKMQAMIELVTPITGPEPKLELFPMGDDEVVAKFCTTQDGTNIKIKIDTALL